MSESPLPEALGRFVARQMTRSVADLWAGAREEPHSPYGSYWYRAVACLLLSGRVRGRHDGTPKRTDGNRGGKEGNFNQHLTQRGGAVLVAGGGGRSRCPGPVGGGG